MNNEAIAERFNRLANLMEIRGDDRYRIRSYRNAAEVIETWPTALKKIAAEEGIKGLQTLPGVGKAISGKIIELLERGTFDAWEKLIAETPESTLDLMRVGGIAGAFVAGGGLEMVDGIGERSAERIRESLKRL